MTMDQLRSSSTGRRRQGYGGPPDFARRASSKLAVAVRRRPKLHAKAKGLCAFDQNFQTKFTTGAATIWWPSVGANTPTSADSRSPRNRTPNETMPKPCQK